MAVPLGVARSRPPDDRDAWSRPFGYLLFVAIVWGALSFGAVYPWAYWPLAAVCAGLGLWALVTTGGWRLRRPGTLALSLWAVGLAIALQLVPLPYGAFVRVTPAADRFFRDYEIGYALRVPGWHAVSLAPDSTRDVLFLFAALALLLVGLTHALRRMVSLEWLASRVIAFGVALGIFGAVQKSLDYTGHQALIYGVWEPSRLGNPFGPFINRNHFAGWMLMALALAMGYACATLEMSRRPRGGDWGRWLRWSTTPDASRFLVVVFCLVAMGTSLALTGSRSGIASLAVAVIVLASFVARRVGGQLGRAVAVGIVLFLLAGVVIWAGVGSTVARFSLAATDAPGRWTAWRDTLRMIADFPLFGVGLGNYGLAMLVYQSGPRDAIFFQAHNDYLQLAAEGGVLVLAPALVTAGVLWRTIRRRLADGDDNVLTYWIRAGAIAGLAGIAAQSTLEFSLQLPGITVLFVVLTAIALHRSVSHHAHRV